MQQTRSKTVNFGICFSSYISWLESLEFMSEHSPFCLGLEVYAYLCDLQIKDVSMRS